MSHLRPTIPGSDKPKAIRDYTDGERESAFTQVLDAESQRIMRPSAKPCSLSTAQLLQQLGTGANGKPLPHADKIPEHVLDVLTANAPKPVTK